MASGATPLTEPGAYGGADVAFASRKSNAHLLHYAHAGSVLLLAGCVR